ncbi:hypothetical protein D3C78_1529410 [compost metagenome]
MRIARQRGPQLALQALVDLGIQLHQTLLASLHRGRQVIHLQHAILIAITAELRIAATTDIQGILREGQAQLMLNARLQGRNRLAGCIGGGDQAPVIRRQAQLAGGRRRGRSGHGGRSFAGRRNGSASL